MLKIYTTPSCVYCHALMDWLDDLNIKYEEIDATKNPEFSTVPVTVYESESGETTKILGFDRPAIKKLLKNL
ncbi:glutaredoxin family protein [Candidatus Saccharibacteria bacterium]|nr:glutaredoxin family protein [Candidatus Saccharibacteria bacterium]